ncbi:hypothetical protein JOM56_011711 [Amanita muscaria]
MIVNPNQAPLINLYDDNLISILAYLAPPDLISIRKTCKRLHGITNARILWTRACMKCISHGYPFQNVSLESMSILDLEKSSHNAHRLGQKWLSSNLEPRFSREFPDISSAAIVDVRFVPGHGDKWIVTISKSVWSVLALWDISDLRSHTWFSKPTKWSPKGGVFKSFCLNSDVTSLATLAIGLLHNGTEMLYILSIVEVDGSVKFKTITSFPTGFSPVALDGDLIALSDQESQVVIWNWRTHEHATLCIGENDESDGWKQNGCSQVLFSRSSNTTLVVREQSIHLFPFPELKSIEQDPLTYIEIAFHHFGWIAGISVTMADSPRDSLGHNLPSFSIVLRRKGSNPWSSDVHSIEHYTILPDPTYDHEHFMSLPEHPSSAPGSSPYIFPPVLQSQIPNLRGSLSNIVRSMNIALGRSGTAVWINPRDWAAAGLLGSDDEYAAHLISPISRCDERLMAAVLQGPLLHQNEQVMFKGTIFSNDGNNWTAMAYDEDRGRIVVGSSSGNLAVILL